MVIQSKNETRETWNHSQHLEFGINGWLRQMKTDENLSEYWKFQIVFWMSTTIKTERTDVKCQQGVLCVWYNVHTRLDGIEFVFSFHLPFSVFS